MRLRTASVLLVALLATSALAQPPARLGYQGRLLKADGSAETGVVDVTFKLFDSETGGTALWTEAQKLALSDGFYATFLGDVASIPAGVIDGDRWLELTINGEPLSPRQKLGSVAFALSANDARNVTGGSVDASSISIAGKQVVDSSGQLKVDAGAAFALKQHQHDAAEIASGVFSLDRIPHTGLDADLFDGLDSSAFVKQDDQIDWTKLKAIPVGFADGKDDGLTSINRDATLVGDGVNDALGVNLAAVQVRVSGSCGSGFVLRGINQDGSVVCAPDADSGGTVTGVTATGPLVSSGGKTPQLSLTTQCTANQILKWNGSIWSCANDEDTAPTAGAGIAITGRAISLGACPTGQLWKSLGNGSWACADDKDTTYLAGAGLALSGNTFSLRTNCNAGELLKWDGADWTCAADENAGGTVTSVGASGPLSSTGGKSPTISIATASGSQAGALSANDWNAFHSKVGSVEATTGGGVLVGGSATAPTVGLRADCTAGQLLKWDGSAWGCAADVDTDTNTTYTASNGVALSGTTLSLGACPAGQLWKSTGNSWICAADVDTDTTYTAGSGLELSGTRFSLLSSCSAGELLKWDGTQWVCAPDDDAGGTVTNVGAIGGGGLVVGGNAKAPALGMRGDCSAGQMLKWDGAAWACANDVDTDTDTNTTYSAGNGLALSGTTLSLAGGCNAGELFKFDGTQWVCAPDENAGGTVTSVGASGPLSSTGGKTPVLTLNGCSSGEILKWNGSAWACTADDDTTYGVAAGGGLALSGTTLSLLTSCQPGELLKWTGTAWACAPDDDAKGTVTSVGATGVLSSTGGNAPSIALTGVVGTSNGGTGINAAPTTAGQFLKSTGSGTWGIGTLAASDVPSLSGSYVDLSGNQTIGGTKTFANPIVGSISGNAGTVTNGVYTSGSYADPAWITALAGSKITGTVASASNANTVTNGIYTTGSYADPAWITAIAGAKITGTVASANTANTVTNGVYTTGSYVDPAWLTSIAGSKITGTVASASNANTVTNGIYTTGSYADPTWITALAGSKITGTVASAASFTGSLGGDVTGAQGTTTVAKIRGVNVSATAPTDGFVLKYNAATTSWVAAADNNSGGTLTGVTAGAGITVSGSATNPTIAVSAQVGTSPATAQASCAALYAAGARISGRYYINPSGSNAYQEWCDMETNGGGWTMVYNSVMGVDTLNFWYILYADRLANRGTPDIATNHYNGDLYRYGRTYMDLVEDEHGKIAIAMVATATAFDTATMRFTSPAYVSGDSGIYGAQFASGWSAPDYDGDTASGSSCATSYANVTQHYSSCWSYNLGADAESPIADGNAGPHVYSSAASGLGLWTDGTSYTRVRRITRYAKW